MSFSPFVVIHHYDTNKRIYMDAYGRYILTRNWHMGNVDVDVYLSKIKYKPFWRYPPVSILNGKEYAWPGRSAYKKIATLYIYISAGRSRHT